MVRRTTRTTPRSPEETARLKALRAEIEATKPGIEDALETGQKELLPAKDFYMLRAVAADLRKERERQGLTLADVAARTGMDTAVLSRLENGKTSNPTFATLFRVARALGKELYFEMRDLPGPQA